MTSANTQTIRIESNIPVPDKNGVGLIQKALRQMAVGDSCVIKQSSQAAVYAYAKANGCKFQFSKLPQYAPTGHARVWLIERRANGKAA